MKQRSSCFRAALGVLFCAFLFSACASTKNVVYLKDAKDSEIGINDNLEPVIQRNDLLSMTVTSPNATATQLFNTTVTVSTNVVGYTSTQASGYLVDQDGYIDIPMLGRMKAAGLTKKELKEKITSSLVDNKLLMDPVVSVRYLNFKVTVLGEVARPMVINVPDEKINILEALGFAGDMTIYAKRDNVVLVREEGGKRITKRLNLNSDEVLRSPYYYLKTNDIIYVEPTKAKVNYSGNTKTWLPALLAGLSAAVVIIDYVTR
ncbi:MULTISPECIES: polysaccharide biosynthesis/export family protein [Niastella]|uniref:Polysaccharide biosynthesis/export family protein n=1 Tax=Niastella soli TaxID=2821487 RepID=A0ABS3Z261_9BACT|nr:polysaccharide biosynthesis/export family protein [Niastella soli]MBO9204243.1 polysaccharide biosynthesis/export family protein [Niastella soli]